MFVNCWATTTTNTPFGGFKNSGIGRELGYHGLRNYLETKTVIMKRPDHSSSAPSPCGSSLGLEMAERSAEKRTWEQTRQICQEQSAVPQTGCQHR